MRVLLSLCAVLVLLWSTVQCRPRHDHNHHGNDHSHHDNDHSHHGNNDVSISANGSLKIYQENLDFAFRLYKHISAQPDSQSKNVFFSPLSVSMALAALSVGARGKTHQQLFEGLGFNSTEITTEEVSQAFQHIHHNLNEKTGIDLLLGNALFIGQDFKPRPEFLESMKRYYESEGFSTDFSKPEEAKEQINKYVNEKTKGKISDLVQDVDPLTVMYIINYIYFKGKWQIPFDPKATKEHDFHVDDKTTVSVPMMYEEDYFHVYQDEDISILQLHYNESVSMMLVLPEKGLQGLEEVVCKNHLQKWIRSVAMMNYQVYVPKLSLKTSYELKEILPEMGITDIFGDTADLT
ncbi:alpha-1-antiproteinase 2-like [Conger conger]|uniref:alpha-1-antiproteinase 2-like n=1 Tax=Conger conger TaxID=82655 RepID=UPI002A5A99FC|nr:alpha-1-antiproteinase 2-like [Conger conger]